MNTKPDQVVKDLNSWINRSAGQHQRRVSEGSASARRVLHIVDTENMGERDGVSVGGCCTGDCNQGRDCPVREFDDDAPLMTMLELFAIVLIVGGFALLAYSYIR